MNEETPLLLTKSNMIPPLKTMILPNGRLVYRYENRKTGQAIRRETPINDPMWLHKDTNDINDLLVFRNTTIESLPVYDGDEKETTMSANIMTSYDDSTGITKLYFKVRGYNRPILSIYTVDCKSDVFDWLECYKLNDITARNLYSFLTGIEAEKWYFHLVDNQPIPVYVA